MDPRLRLPLPELNLKGPLSTQQRTLHPALMDTAPEPPPRLIKVDAKKYQTLLTNLLYRLAQLDGIPPALATALQDDYGRLRARSSLPGFRRAADDAPIHLGTRRERRPRVQCYPRS